MRKGILICYIFTIIILPSGCNSINNSNSLSFLGFATETPVLTQTLTPFLPVTSTPTFTPSPRPSMTPFPTRTMLDYLRSEIPEEPEGFKWNLIEDMQVIVLLPDGWFLNREYCPVVNFFGSQYVLKEDIGQACISNVDLNIEEKYEIGLSIQVFSDVEYPDEFAQFMLGYLSSDESGEMFIYPAGDEGMDEHAVKADLSNIHNTVEVLNAYDAECNGNIIHHLHVKAEYPFATDGNRYKIVHYATLETFTNHVVLLMFETPLDQWDSFFEEYGFAIEQVVYYQNQ